MPDQSDNSGGLNKLYRWAAADKEFLRLLIGQKKKECSFIRASSLSQKSLDLLINQEDDYSDDHYRRSCRQRFLRSYELGVEKKHNKWLEKKQECMEVYNSVKKATRCYKFGYVINSALFCTCNYVAKQYKYFTRIMKRKV